MDIEHYEDHLMELERVLETALQRVAERYPAYEDDLYIVGLEVDGQYHKVTVGVANVRDETVTVDSTRLIAKAEEKVLTAEDYGRLVTGSFDAQEVVDKLRDHFGDEDLVSHDDPRPRRFRIRSNYPDVTIVAVDEATALEEYDELLDAEDRLGETIVEDLGPAEFPMPGRRPGARGPLRRT